MTKSELRKLYLERRQMLSEEEKKRKSEEIVSRFFSAFDVSSMRYLHCFISIKKFNEISTRPIFERIWKEFPAVKTVVPRVNLELNEIESLIYTRETETISGRWGILEPKHNELVSPQMLDAVLVPLLCFDTTGHRVGYGKGYYDRLLNTCRPDCLKIGLSYFESLDRISDPHEGDIQLDYCITPSGICEFSDQIYGLFIDN